MPDSHAPRTHYSPERRTALVLTGTGIDGAYHAGALHALAEAGVRLDVVAGRGVGTVGALFAAIDGGARLWEPGGLWRTPLKARLYPWRPAYQRVAWGLSVAALLLVIPALLLALGLVVYQIALLADVVGAGTARWLADRWGQLLGAIMAPRALPTILPQLVTVVLAVILVAVFAGALRARRALPARRDQRGGTWWTLLGTPFSAEAMAEHVIGGLWDLLRGGANVKQPTRTDLSRRYAELLADNLGQPGFRELLFVAHDLDARHDIVFAMLGSASRRAFFQRRLSDGPDRRSSETVDLGGASRDVLLDALAGSLAVAPVTDSAFIGFAPESYWRGETHRLVDRPGSLLRVMEELARAGVRQIIVVAATAEHSRPHGLTTRRVDPRARVSEYLASEEAAVIRDALPMAEAWFDAIFLVRPAHNPVSALDADGAFDAQSDRWQSVGELVDRGYEDAYRQFVDPIVGASGDEMVSNAALTNED